MGKGIGEKEAGSLALVWTLWFLHTYALRLEVAAGMPLALSLLWESLRCIAHKACLIAAIFFFLQTIKCVTVYSRALLHTEGCLYPHLEAYRSNFYMRMYIYFIEGTDGTLNRLLRVRYRRQMKGLHMIL